MPFPIQIYYEDMNIINQIARLITEDPAVVSENYCPACGGWDIKQGGKGHKIGCPVGKAGTQIKSGTPGKFSIEHMDPDTGNRFYLEVSLKVILESIEDIITQQPNRYIQNITGGLREDENHLAFAINYVGTGPEEQFGIPKGPPTILVHFVDNELEGVAIYGAGGYADLMNIHSGASSDANLMKAVDPSLWRTPDPLSDIRAIFSKLTNEKSLAQWHSVLEEASEYFINLK